MFLWLTTQWTPHSLLRVSILRKSSRPRPKQAFQIDRSLFHDLQGKGNGFPFLNHSRVLKREELLRRLRFPREYGPTHRKTWWTITWIPSVLRAIVIRLKDFRMPPVQKDVVVKSQIGRFFYEFVSGGDFLPRLNLAVQPWGFFGTSEGESMQPTFAGCRSIHYSSYAYVDRRGIHIGDVVIVLGINWEANEGGLWGKRVAGLEGDRICVMRRGAYRTFEVESYPMP